MKLVRDNILKIIEKSGTWCICKSASSKSEHMMWLSEKMKEEVLEFIENPCYEEAGDIFEVLRCFASLNGLHMDKVMCAADEKRSDLGGFDRGIMLEPIGKKEQKVKPK